MQGHRQKTVINQESDLTSTKSAGALVLDFPATSTVRTKFVTYRPTSLWYCHSNPKQMKTPTFTPRPIPGLLAILQHTEQAPVSGLHTRFYHYPGCFSPKISTELTLSPLPQPRSSITFPVRPSQHSLITPATGPFLPHMSSPLLCLICLQCIYCLLM